MGLTAIDLGLRGAASGVFLMIVLMVLQRRATNQLALLGTAMAAGGAFYAIVTAPVFPKSSLWWTLPILSSLPAVFWLWARASFDDDFVLRRRHGVLWLTILAVGFAVSLGWTTWPNLARGGSKVLSAVAVLLALAAAVQTVKTWRVDLVARRRRLRLAVLAINVVFIGVVAGAGVAAVPVAVPGEPGSLPTAISLFVLAMLAGLGVLDLRAIVTVNDAAAAIRPGDTAGRPVTDRSPTGRGTADPVLLRRLDHLMTVERIYRQEGLAIGALAARLDVPEHRLRQAINEGLGYRNFNAFLNHYRIEDAKLALSDVTQREVPVLTIAMDAGFQSIGPFNRAFKAETGVTPTEFRREALIRPQTAPDADRHFKIGQPRREIG
ncbi:AraC-like DNA-binding protein [Bradyrhizobium sp. JR7.2]|uniref:AraC family transcriptional regulator n=1 Tax=unclassified Bradyrhizobium TaxID=2631580 RepID=UPI0033907E09